MKLADVSLPCPPTLTLALESSIKSAQALNGVLKHNLSPELAEMRAVAQQTEIFLKIRGHFSRRLRTFLKSLFKKTVDEAMSTKKRGLDIEKHTEDLARPLGPFKPLVHWCRETERDLRETDYSEYLIEKELLEGLNPGDSPSVVTDYSSVVSSVYKRDIKTAFHGARKLILREKAEKCMCNPGG